MTTDIDIKELVGERLAILAEAQAPKPKPIRPMPKFHLMIVESRDVVAVYYKNDLMTYMPTHFPYNILYRKYYRHHSGLNAETVKIDLENDGHLVTIG